MLFGAALTRNRWATAQWAASKRRAAQAARAIRSRPMRRAILPKLQLPQTPYQTPYETEEEAEDEEVSNQVLGSEILPEDTCPREVEEEPQEEITRAKEDLDTCHPSLDLERPMYTNLNRLNGAAPVEVATVRTKRKNTEGFSSMCVLFTVRSAQVHEVVQSARC